MFQRFLCLITVFLSKDLIFHQFIRDIKKNIEHFNFNFFLSMPKIINEIIKYRYSSLLILAHY